MNYEKVESSQIAEIGYEPSAGTEPGTGILGIKFPPNKKQQAAGLPGSEYTYDNMEPSTYRALMAAESIGSYFGKNIKSRPDLYPYMKIEADTNPPQPPPSPNGGGRVQTVESQTQTQKTSSGAENTIQSEPSTALAVIDTMADDLLFTPGAVTDAQLAAGRDWYLTEAKKYDISTEKSRTELKRFARPLQKLRTGIEARAKELTGATKRKIAAIDAEKRRLVMLVGGIEDEVLAPLTAWEQEEDSRKARLAGIQNELAVKGQRVYATIADLETAIAELESFDLSTMQEYKIGAESSIAASLTVLKPELERRRIAEANEAELAKLRADAAARSERDRLEAVAREAREQAEKQAAWQAEIDRRKVEDAEQRARDAEAKGKADAEAAVEAERQRIAEAEAREQAEAQAWAADEAHREEVHCTAKHAIAATCNISTEAAASVVEAIAKGYIPNVTISYQPERTNGKWH